MYKIPEQPTIVDVQPIKLKQIVIERKINLFDPLNHQKYKLLKQKVNIYFKNTKRKRFLSKEWLVAFIK